MGHAATRSTRSNSSDLDLMELSQSRQHVYTRLHTRRLTGFGLAGFLQEVKWLPERPNIAICPGAFVPRSHFLSPIDVIRSGLNFAACSFGRV